MSPEQTIALRRMGYRHMGKDVWGKPIAYHILLVRIENGEAIMTNHFFGIKLQPLVWERLPINGKTTTEFEASLKLAEFSTRVDVGQPQNSASMAFSTQEEIFADMM